MLCGSFELKKKFGPKNDGKKGSVIRGLTKLARLPCCCCLKCRPRFKIRRLLKRQIDIDKFGITLNCRASSSFEPHDAIGPLSEYLNLAPRWIQKDRCERYKALGEATTEDESRALPITFNASLRWSLLCTVLLLSHRLIFRINFQKQQISQTQLRCR